MGIYCRLTRLGNANDGYAVKWPSKIWCGFAAMPRSLQRPPGNSRFAGLLPDSEVIQRVEIAESPVKRAFRGVPIQFQEFSFCHLTLRRHATLRSLCFRFYDTIAAAPWIGKGVDLLLRGEKFGADFPIARPVLYISGDELGKIPFLPFFFNPFRKRRNIVYVRAPGISPPCAVVVAQNPLRLAVPFVCVKHGAGLRDLRHGVQQ